MVTKDGREDSNRTLKKRCSQVPSALQLMLPDRPVMLCLSWVFVQCLLDHNLPCSYHLCQLL